MDKSNELKEMVKQKYGEIAVQDKETSCCAASCCSTTEVYNIMSEDYSTLNGYNADADLGLGCGLPTQFARIKTGDTVVDLGSGAGNDCFVARAETGETGKIIGIDFTPAMLTKARENTIKRGYKNVEFREGDIENMPVGGNSVDVVISNCVLNLLPKKDKVFKEIFRVLKPGGHFCISDVVLEGELPQPLTEAAEMYAGCVSGAIQKDKYLIEIFSAGFQQVKVEKQKAIIIPDEVLLKYLNQQALEKYKTEQIGIYSITVTGVKPAGCGCDCEC